MSRLTNSPDMAPTRGAVAGALRKISGSLAKATGDLNKVEGALGEIESRIARLEAQKIVEEAEADAHAKFWRH